MGSGRRARAVSLVYDLLAHLGSIVFIDEFLYHKVNRCLARYSPRHNHQPTHNRALNKPAWPGPD